MKKLTTVFMVALMMFSLFACKSEEEKKETLSHENAQTTEKIEDSDTETEEEQVEIIYAKTPSEAADKCIEAFKSGNLYDAKHYVAPNGNAFKEISAFRKNMVKSFGVEGNKDLTALAEKLVNNVLVKTQYIRTETKEKGNSATVTYKVLMPDMQSIDYSKYSDSYMAAAGITQEQLMMQLEGMTEEESQNWAMEYSLNVMNYIFESGAAFKTTTETTTVTVKKHKDGWLVSNIDNL